MVTVETLRKWLEQFPSDAPVDCFEVAGFYDITVFEPGTEQILGSLDMNTGPSEPKPKESSDG